MPGQVVLSRQELYDLVWSKAVWRDEQLEPVAVERRLEAAGLFDQAGEE